MSSELDTRGMRCPRPVIELARLAKELLATGSPAGEPAEGASVTVLSDDPAAPGDIAAWCRMRGHELLDQESDQEGTTVTALRIRRTPAAAATAVPPPTGAGTSPG